VDCSWVVDVDEVETSNVVNGFGGPEEGRTRGMGFWVVNALVGCLVLRTRYGYLEHSNRHVVAPNQRAVMQNELSRRL